MQDDTSTSNGSPASRREWAGLAVLALPTLLISLDIGVLFLALPHLSADLGAGGVQQLWITDIYGFMLAGFLITMGTLGDRIGRRRLLLVGAAVFGLASVLAAFSPTPEVLIAARGLLGIAGATLMPSTLALISTMFTDPRQRGLAISVWATCQFTGAALGPVVGGLLLEHFWWGAAFLLGVPVMVLLLALGPVVLPETRSHEAGRMDLPSVALSLAALLPVVYGVKELAVHGVGLLAITAVVVGLVFGSVFVYRQLTLEDPLLDLRLLSRAPIGVTLTAMLLIGACLAGMFLLTSQYLQSVLRFSPAAAGLWTAFGGLSIAVGSLLSPMLTRRIRHATAITAGLVVSFVGFLLLTGVGAEDGLVAAVTGISLIHLGAGPLVSLGTGLVVSGVPPERAGSAASISETSNHLGSTLGMAALGTLAAAVYHTRMAGFPDEAVETVAGADALAARLPEARRAELLDAAHSAFAEGLNATAWVGAAVTAALVSLIAVMLRRTGSSPAAEDPRAPEDREPSAPQQESETADRSRDPLRD
ncbi:MFS transporter [Microbacterium soli]|uniref:MFS transporter n=1 Tax=Microbacterium soli TaxID=446075 RepID=A0ABP7MSD6_9MICO